MQISTKRYAPNEIASGSRLRCVSLKCVGGLRASRLLILVTVLSGAVVLPLPSNVAAAPTGATRFVPAGPVRIMDTRSGIGVVAGLRQPGATVDLLVDEVPASATAVVLNVTITESIQAGFVQALPTGGGVLGASSNLNVTASNVTIANLVTVPLGGSNSDQVTFYNTAGGHLLADLFGYFEPSTASTSGRFVGLTAPSRVLDTRDPLQVPIANPGNVVDCGGFANWDAANRWFWTYRRHGDPGELDGDDDGVPCQSLPGNPGRVVIPADLFKLGDGQSYRLPVRTNATPAGGVVPADASAIVMNVTAVETTGPGFLQVFSNDGDRGAWSNLNYGVGDFAPNLIVAPIGADGSVKFYARTSSHVIADVIGYFTGDTSPSSSFGLFVPFAPDRLIDTRDVGPALAAGTLRTENVAAQAALDPASVSAMFLNATIAGSLAPGFLQVFPTGQSSPGASSNVNVSGPGQFRPNATITGVANGQVSVYLSSGGHYILDAAGYFTSGST